MTSSARNAMFNQPSFKVGDRVVYPSYGVGEIVGLEQQELLGRNLELFFAILFDSKKMLLRVPASKIPQTGMRPLSSPDVMDKAMVVVRGRPRIKRAMWARRAQEYETKINSGNLIFIAEVVRDLHKSGDQSGQSYSERQLYELALERMASEFAVATNTPQKEVTSKIEAEIRGAVRGEFIGHDRPNRGNDARHEQIDEGDETSESKTVDGSTTEGCEVAA